MKKIKILCVRFRNELRPFEIEMFRGAVLDKLQETASVLFHNHVGDGFRYSYPLIQYKCLGGRRLSSVWKKGQRRSANCFPQAIFVSGSAIGWSI